MINIILCLQTANYYPRVDNKNEYYNSLLKEQVLFLYATKF